jgi:hypothetical protein
MNVTLRKASVLQTAINDAIRGIGTEAEITVNEFQDGESAVQAAADTFRASIARRDALTRALYSIRSEVAQVNFASGVNTMLTQVAEIEKQIQFYTVLAAKTVRLEAKVLEGQLAKLRVVEAKNTIYGYKDSVTTSVLTAEDVAGFKKTVSELKRSKQKLQDSILEANVRNEITLSETSEATLRSEGLL